MKKYTLSVFIICLLTGCISAPGIPFSVVSLDVDLADVTVLQRDVIGEDCPDGLSGYGSYSKATSQAIRSVEGATALINAKFSRAEKPIGKLCVRVVGDAVAI